jgi:hypothetical protein
MMIPRDQLTGPRKFPVLGQASAELLKIHPDDFALDGAEILAAGLQPLAHLLQLLRRELKRDEEWPTS